MSAKEKLLAALKEAFPGVRDESVTQLETVVDDVIAEINASATAELQEAHAKELAEIDAQIEENYAVAHGMIKDLQAKVEETERIALEGYEQAYNMLTETEKIALEGYEQAYVMLREQEESIEKVVQERTQQLTEDLETLKIRSESAETAMQEEYERRISETREWLVDKIDAFMSERGEEVIKRVYHEVTTHPAVVAESNALREIKAIANRTVIDDSDEEAPEQTTQETAAATEDVKELETENLELREKLRTSESKNTRIQLENNQLAKEVRNLRTQVLKEASADKPVLAETATPDSKTDKPAEKPNEDKRVKPAIRLVEGEESVEGRGMLVAADDIIREAIVETATSDGTKDNAADEQLDESIQVVPGLSTEDLLRLAGVKVK